MRSFLCAEFLDFAGSLYGTSLEALGEPACDPESCPGPDHLRAWAERVALQSGIPSATLLCRFGAALFGRLIRGYPAFLVGIESTLDLVGRYDGQILTEIRKLNDGARLPHISLRRREGEPPEVIYHSSRGLADLAEGLLLGSIAYFGEPFALERRATAEDGPDHAVFRILAQPPR
jgi:hypothetical protein